VTRSSSPSSPQQTCRTGGAGRDLDVHHLLQGAGVLERSNSTPPRAVQDTGSGPVQAAFASAAQTALGRDFVSSVERILFFNVGFWALTGILRCCCPGATATRRRSRAGRLT